MPIPDKRSKYKRATLFLLRVWCDAPGPDLDEKDNGKGDEDEDKGERSGLAWHGRVQSPVSGEAHNFEGKEALVAVLEAMLYKNRPEHSRPQGKTTSEVSLRPGSSNQAEAIEGTQ